MNYSIWIYSNSAKWIKIDIRNKGIQEGLKEANRLKKPGYCSCKGVQENRPKLSLRNRSGKIHVAVYPRTGDTHDAECCFYRASPSRSGQKQYSQGVIREDDEGYLHVLLDTPLQVNASVQTGGAQTPVSETVPGGPSVKRNRMTPLGLLHLLWENAALNTWGRWQRDRDWFDQVWSIRNAAKSIKIGKTAMIDALAILTPNGGNLDQDNLSAMLDIFRSAKERGRKRLLILGEVDRLESEKLRVRMKDDGKYNVWLNATRADLVSLSQCCEKQDDERLIGFFIARVDGVYPSKSQGRSPCFQTCIVASAIMKTTMSLIPFASRYEKRVAELLVEQNRSFRKPLRYDATDAVFPDFVLLDTPGREYPMEVYGMSHESYQKRREEKERYYWQEFGMNHWVWTAVGESAQPDPPPFPPAR